MPSGPIYEHYSIFVITYGNELVTTTRYTEICRRCLNKRHRIVGMTRPVISTVSQGTASNEYSNIHRRSHTGCGFSYDCSITYCPSQRAYSLYTIVQLLIVVFIADYAVLATTAQKFIVEVIPGTHVNYDWQTNFKINIGTSAFKKHVKFQNNRR